MPANLENSAVAAALEKVNFHSNPKERQFLSLKNPMDRGECSNYHTIVLISHSSNVMHKILQARLQLYVNWELPDVQAGFRIGRGTRGHISNTRWIIVKTREFQKISTSASLTTLKSLTVWITTNCGNFLQEMGIPDHHTCLLRNPYAGQEATVRTAHGTTE